MHIFYVLWKLILYFFPWYFYIMERNRITCRLAIWIEMYYIFLVKMIKYNLLSFLFLIAHNVSFSLWYKSSNVPYHVTPNKCSLFNVRTQHKIFIKKIYYMVLIKHVSLITRKDKRYNACNICFDQTSLIIFLHGIQFRFQCVINHKIENNDFQFYIFPNA